MALPEIAPQDLAQRLAQKEGSKPVLLDVRSASEHAIARLPDSVLIPLQELANRVDELDKLKGKEVVVYCHHGMRSQNGAAFLISRGIDARTLAGGIDRWSLTVDPKIPRY